MWQRGVLTLPQTPPLTTTPPSAAIGIVESSPFPGQDSQRVRVGVEVRVRVRMVVLEEGHAGGHLRYAGSRVRALRLGLGMG